MATSISSSPYFHLPTNKRPSAISEPLRSHVLILPLRERLGSALSSQATRATTFSESLVTETETEISTGSSRVQLLDDSSSSANIAKDWRSKGSLQLTRWVRTRKLRSGRSAAPLLEAKTPSTLEPLLQNGEAMQSKLHCANDDDNDHVTKALGVLRRENSVYMVSDGTGWTAEHSVHAALGQFEHCFVDHGCPVSTHLFSEVNDVDRLLEIIQDAGKEQAVLVYTIADPTLAEAAKTACELHGIPHLDIFGPITELLSTFLGVSPLGLPRGAPGRKSALSKQYFKRIEAVEFTIKQDDGALPKNLHKADLVLVGVSRTSKTPLSTYIAQKGYKVANVPLVLGIDPPSELSQIDQSKVYALTINPNYLHSIRVARSKTLGVSMSTSYSEMEHIKKELDFSHKLFLDNPKWPVIEVTGKAIEETAAVILRIYHDRHRKYVMPRISWRY